MSTSDWTGLRPFRERWGSSMPLHGNLAPQGVLLDLNTLPEDMMFVRYSPVVFNSPQDAAEALADGEIPPDTAVVILDGTGGGGSAGMPVGGGSSSAGGKRSRGRRLPGRELARAMEAGGAHHLLFITDGCVEGSVPGAANIVYASAEAASGLDRLRPTDKLEYDVWHQRINLDLSEGFPVRMGRGPAADPESTPGPGMASEPVLDMASEPDVSPHPHFVVRRLGEGVWSILERYSRMFLIAGRERALLLDTGFGDEDPRELIQSLTDLPFDVVISHGHWDHTGGMDYFPETWIRQEDISALPQEKRGGLRPLTEGKRFSLGGRTLEVIHCPGHTEGCVSLLDYENRLLFSGDAIFQGPVYLFLPESSPRAFLASMEKMEGMADRFDVVYPCHKQLPLTPSCFAQARQCAQDALSGAVKGIPTRVSPCGRGLNTYFNGQVGIFL